MPIHGYRSWLVGSMLALLPILAGANGTGQYVGTVQTEWLADGRQMRLLAPFAYVDGNGLTWNAPAGSVIDGASIPQLAWTFAGGPFEGRYRDASVIHDVACVERVRSWESVHEVFYRAMLTSGVESWRAKVMYAAVYHFGPRWPRAVTVRNVPLDRSPDAEQRALEGAEAGTHATVAHVFRHNRTFGQILGNRAATGDFTVVLTPPAPRLTEEDFERLKDAIASQETTEALSLEQIRDYMPAAR